jgi:hypothetical protein
MIHFEAKFLPRCETVKPDKLCAYKIQWRDKHRVDIPTARGENQREERK